MLPMVIAGLLILFILLLLLNLWVSFFFLISAFGFLTRSIDYLLYITLIFLLLHTPMFYAFKVSVRYLDIFILFFIVYYLFFYVEKIDNLLATIRHKTFLSLFALIFFVLVLSQVQSAYITFPITTIRPGAYANYPFIKSSLRLAQLFILFLFALCISHVAQKISWKKVVTMHTNVATGLSGFLLVSFILYYILPSNSIFRHVTVHSDEMFIRLSGYFFEPSVLALYLLTSIPILCATLAEQFSRREAIGLFLQVICLFLTFSRAGWLAFLVISPFLFLFFFKDILKGISHTYLYISYRKIGFLFCLVLFFLFVVVILYQPATEIAKGLFFDPIQLIFEPDAKKFWSTRLRLETYSIAVDAFQEHPLFGIGIFNYHFYGGVRRDDSLFHGLYLNYPEVNNLYLSFLAEIGIVGVLILSYCALLVFRHFYRLIIMGDKKTSLRARGVFVSIIGIAMMMVFISKYTYPFLWFFIGLSVAVSSPNEEQSRESYNKIESSKKQQKYQVKTISRMPAALNIYSQKSYLYRWLLQEGTSLSYERGSFLFASTNTFFFGIRQYLFQMSKQSIFITFFDNVGKAATIYSSLLIILFSIALLIVGVINFTT